jgi:carbon monoxide dehydrogenase subunit G
LILALPVVSIAFASGLGLRSPALAYWHYWSFFVCGVPGIAFGFVAVSQAPKPDVPIDGDGQERYMRSVGLAAACFIAGLAVLVGAALSSAAALAIVAIVAMWVLVWTPLWLRRVITESQAVIRRDPAVVFSFLADSQNEPRYVPTVDSVEKITDGPIRAGTQFRAHVRDGLWEGVAEIVVFEPNSRLTVRVVSSLKPNVEMTTFVPVSGGTLITRRFESEISFNGSIFGSAFRLPQAKRRMLANRQAGWIKLKQILESTVSPNAEPI